MAARIALVAMVAIVARLAYLFAHMDSPFFGYFFLDPLWHHQWATMIAKGKPLSTPVGDVASTPLMVTDVNVNVYEAANIMTHNRIKRLPLVDENDELRGIITARDLVEAFSK